MTQRTHHPLCDVSLGPDFKVDEGSVTMVLHVCVGFECWDEQGEVPPWRR